MRLVISPVVMTGKSTTRKKKKSDANQRARTTTTTTNNTTKEERDAEELFSLVSSKIALTKRPLFCHRIAKQNGLKIHSTRYEYETTF